MTRRALARSALFAVLFAVLVISAPSAQGPEVQFGANVEIGEREKNTPARPTPRHADGRVNLGPYPGEFGMWFPFRGVAERVVNPDDISEADEARFPDRLRIGDVPLQPWARALYAYRRSNPFEPHTRCKPSGGPRQFITPYGVEFVHIPELRRVFIIDLGGPHSYREIYMDGRSHPRNLTPSYYGHSVGHWDKDTLVVDTRGFNEGFWFDRQGLPHTDRLHMIERFTRTDSKTIRYEVTIDDPGAYTRPWSGGFLLGWEPQQDLFEYICQENNTAQDLLVGSQEFVNRQSPIVP